MSASTKKYLAFSTSSKILHIIIISHLRATCPLQLIILCFLIQLKIMARQQLFKIYIIGLYLEQQIKISHFLHDLKMLSESPTTSKYVVMLPSHTDTVNTALQYYILEMSVSAALLLCHQMLCQQRQLITPQIEFSPTTIHMGVSNGQSDIWSGFSQSTSGCTLSVIVPSVFHIHPFITR